MIVKELIKTLKRQDQEANIIIAESQYSNANVLVLLTDESNPDDALEIALE